MPRFPGPLSRAMLDELSRYVIAEPWPFAVDIDRCRGMDLATVDGQPVRDWGGLYGSRLIGWNHPRLRDPAVRERLASAAACKTTNPDLLTPQCLAYYRLLHEELAPRCMRNDRLEVYAVNSGAEAVENLMKYFINLHLHRCQQRQVRPALRRFIVFDQAFHGRTVYALNATRLAHDPVMTLGFHGLTAHNLVVDFPTAEAAVAPALHAVAEAIECHGDEIAGIIVEPIQGAGGHRIAPAGFFARLSELAHRHGIPLGFDEVQTAGGQCGAVFAADLLDLPHPPMGIATAKKFGCGVVYMLHPMDDLGVLDSTWGGTLADMVRAVEEFAVVREERLIEQVPAKAERLVAGLDDLIARHPQRLGHRRGLGLYQGFTVFGAGAKAVLIDAALERESLLLLGAGADSIRLRPPLDVGAAEIDGLVAALGRLLMRM